MGDQTPHELLWREDAGRLAVEENANIRAFHRHWANLYRARLSQCNHLRASLASPQADRGGDCDANGEGETYLIVRDNGRVVVDIHGNPAVFASRTEAERWLMPDEHVEACQSGSAPPA